MSKFLLLAKQQAEAKEAKAKESKDIQDSNLLKPSSDKPSEVEGTTHTIQAGTTYKEDVNTTRDVVINGESLLDLDNYRIARSEGSFNLQMVKELIAQSSYSHIPFSEEQVEYARMVLNGEDCILFGGAGSGKSTTSLVAIEILTKLLGTMSLDHRHVENDVAAILVVAFTNTALNNIKDQLPPELKGNAVTIHKALEAVIEPVENLLEDGTVEVARRTVFHRDEHNPLNGVEVIMIDEGTLVNLELMEKLVAATSPECQFIMIGDLFQQAPPFGRSILEYYCTRLKVHTLTKVYRQADESPVTPFLQDIMLDKLPKPKFLEGKALIEAKQELIDKYQGSNAAGSLNFVWLPDCDKNGILKSWGDSDNFPKAFFEKLKFDSSNSIVLTTTNEMCAAITNGLNNYVSVKNGEEVHQVIAMGQKKYLAVGDYVTFNKRRCIIQHIEENIGYTGTPYAEARVDMGRNGENAVTPKEALQDLAIDFLDDIDFSLGSDGEDSISSSNKIKIIDDEDESTEKRSASHIISLLDLDLNKSTTGEPEEYDIHTSGDVNALEGGHATTTYKAQGLQFSKVVKFLHSTQVNGMTREMLYTGASRTSKHLIMMCSPANIFKCMQRQEIAGNTIGEKLATVQRNPIDFRKSLYIGESR